ncbi:50S ribosomal protein L3 [bacterium]|nr:MAG: 50S ribosomal protein L3 [bacterium]
MSNYIIGKKIGMTQIYDDTGRLTPVTVIEAGPCPIVSVKEKNIQVGFDAAKEKSLSRPVLGIYKKAGVSPRRILREVPRIANQEYKAGQELKVDMFTPGEKVDVIGTSIGKGFQGGMKRWHWHGGPKTHGSTSHRRAGSIGSSTTPGRVWKGHHMPGHMGNARVTVSGLRVVKVDPENNLLAVKGAVAGYKNNYLIIRKTTKHKRQVIKPVIAEQKAEALKKDAKKQSAAKK